MASRTPQPSRRAVLGGALAGLAVPALAACTSVPFTEPEPPVVPPDVVAGDRAAERERELLAAYDAAMLIAPQLADRLLPVRGHHAAHLAALDRPEVPAPAATPNADPAATPNAAPAATPNADPAATPNAAPAATPNADPAASSSATPVPAPPPRVAVPTLPQDPAALLAALAELERRAATAHGGAAVRAGLGVGAVLASLSASEASHAVVLS